MYLIFSLYQISLARPRLPGPALTAEKWYRWILVRAVARHKIQGVSWHLKHHVMINGLDTGHGVAHCLQIITNSPGHDTPLPGRCQHHNRSALWRHISVSPGSLCDLMTQNNINSGRSVPSALCFDSKIAYFPPFTDPSWSGHHKPVQCSAQPGIIQYNCWNNQQSPTIRILKPVIFVLNSLYSQ